MSNTTGLNNVWFYGNWRDSFFYVSDDKVKVYTGFDNWKDGIFKEYDIIALHIDYSQYSLCIMDEEDGYKEQVDISLDLLAAAIDEAIMDYNTGLAKWTKIRDQFKDLA
jgi:hypothetical protein